MIKVEELREDELKLIAKYIDKKCGYAISDALEYKYEVDLNECFGEFEDSDDYAKETMENYVKACNYLNCNDNGASDWLKGDY